jgi:hypothetical protein
MPQATDLLQMYNNIISEPAESDSCISGECVSKLLETSWVKILVIRYELAPQICTIEIEVSLPNCFIEPTYPPPRKMQKEAHEYVNRNIEHLNYLLKLQDAGFSIGVISNEGIWSAILKIKGTPDQELFQTILPPTS